MPPQSAPLPSLQSLRRSFPPILNLPSTSTGNSVPKSLHKTRRTWKTNTQRLDTPLRILDTANRDKQGGSVLKGVKMRMRDLRSFEKAGGVEGALLSQSPNNLTPFGQQLRSDLFQKLSSLRNAQNASKALQADMANSTASIKQGMAGSIADLAGRKTVFKLGI